MKIAIMGAGGLGGFFGGWLAASGADVTFIARGAHLQAMQANGLTITSELGDRHVNPVQATDDPQTIGPVDVIQFCVKNYALEEAARLCLPLLGPHTAVITTLNGIDAAPRIDAIMGPGHAVPGVTLVPSNIARPGVIAHRGENTDLLFGEPDGTISPRLTAFRDACRKAGLDADVTPDITTAIWFKFIGWSSSSSVICNYCTSFGDFNSDPALIELFQQAAHETMAIGRAKGADLDDELIASLTRVMTSFPADAKPSMLVDLQQGRPIEVDSACGAVVRLGKELGIETPINQRLYDGLLPHKYG